VDEDYSKIKLLNLFEKLDFVDLKLVDLIELSH
jgi:hypothetical protein